MAGREPAEPRARLDKWLWAARFFKTRSQASNAVSGGKVHVNGARTKAGHGIKRGDELEISKAGQLFVVVVLALSERRGSADQAQQLYRETTASATERERSTEQRQQARHSMPTPRGQPDKRAQRELRRFKRGQ